VDRIILKWILHAPGVKDWTGSGEGRMASFCARGNALLIP
jgi:hypothetical protein